MMPLIAAYVETAKTALKGGSPKILDVASGTGEPGFSLANAYPEGHVFITNFAEGLLEFHRVLKPDRLVMIGVWGSSQQTQMLSLMQGVRGAIVPNDSFFADPSSLCGCDKVLNAMQHAGFRDISIREINVPMRLPVERLHAGMLQSAVFAALLDRLATRRETGAAKRAHAAALEIAHEKGFQQEEGWVNMLTNLVLFVTARP